MRASQQTFVAFTAVVLASLTLAACGKSSEGSVKVGLATPTARTTALKNCASEIPSSSKTVQASQVAVCRRGEDGKAVDQPLIPSFQVIAKKNRIRIEQVIATRLSFHGAKPTEAVKTAAEQETNAFLTKVCGPHLTSVFKRSGVSAKFIFQTSTAGQTMAGGRSQVSSNANAQDDFDRDEVSTSTSTPSTTGTTATKTTIIDRRTEGPRDVNMILELVMGSDQGVSIRDELDPASSGGLKATGAEIEQKQLQFCGQVLMRVAEGFGLAKGRDCASLAKAAEVKSESAKTEKTETAKTDEASAKTPVKKPGQAVVGLLKPEGHSAEDLKNLRLSDNELFEILSPTCNAVKTASKPK